MFHPIELVQWYETRSNRRVSPPPSPQAFWSLYATDQQPLSGAPASLTQAAQAPTDLLIVLTTYERAQLCLRKIQTLPEVIRESERVKRVHLLVICDRSKDDYGPARELAEKLFAGQVTWLDARTHLGKPGFWKTYQTAFLAAQILQPSHALFLQDDVGYQASLLRDAYALWEASAGDQRRRVLYLFSSSDDERWGRWIRFRSKDLPQRRLRLTQWFDLQGFLVDRAFFELLEYRMVAVHPNRWRRNPNISSGVGAQLTRRLFERGNVYQARPPLLVHGTHRSVMNPGARVLRELDNSEQVEDGFDDVC